MKLPTINPVPPQFLPPSSRDVRRQHEGQWLLGLVLSFLWLLAMNVAIAVTLGASHRSRTAAGLELLLAIALVILLARVYRRQYGSWQWGRGAFIGGLFPAAVGIIQWMLF